MIEEDHSFFLKALRGDSPLRNPVTRETESKFLSWVERTEQASQAVHLIRLGAKILTFSSESGELVLLVPNRYGSGGFERKTFSI